jgi:hypothetical protein
MSIGGKSCDKIIKNSTQKAPLSKDLTLSFQKLQNEYPVLAEYKKLLHERRRMAGYKAEEFDKVLYVKAYDIIKNGPLYEPLENRLPSVARLLFLTAKNHDLGIDRNG